MLVLVLAVARAGRLWAYRASSAEARAAFASNVVRLAPTRVEHEHEYEYEYEYDPA